MKMTIAFNPAKQPCKVMASWSNDQFRILMNNILEEINMKIDPKTAQFYVINIKNDECDADNKYSSEKIIEVLKNQQINANLINLEIPQDDYCKKVYLSLAIILANQINGIAIVVSNKLFRTFPNYYIKQKYPEHKDEFCSTTSYPAGAFIDRKSITIMLPYEKPAF